MERNKISLNSGDTLIIDPCYIKSVQLSGEMRFDALKLVRELFSGDDGEYSVKVPTKDGKTANVVIPVDSGRIWVFKAEFECSVFVDTSVFGYEVLTGFDDWTKVEMNYYSSFTQDGWKAYQVIDKIFLKEDIIGIAEETGDTLTDSEIEMVMEEYSNIESMEYDKRTTLENAIERVIEGR